jgi:hypothetical protein
MESGFFVYTHLRGGGGLLPVLTEAVAFVIPDRRLLFAGSKIARF